MTITLARNSPWMGFLGYFSLARASRTDAHVCISNKVGSPLRATWHKGCMLVWRPKIFSLGKVRSFPNFFVAMLSGDF